LSFVSAYTHVKRQNVRFRGQNVHIVQHNTLTQYINKSMENPHKTKPKVNAGKVGHFIVFEKYIYT